MGKYPVCLPAAGSEGFGYEKMHGGMPVRNNFLLGDGTD